MSNPAKTCRVCAEEKLLVLFPKNRSKPGGYANECKVCDSLRKKDYKAKNPDKVKLSHRTYYVANVETILVKQSDYRKRTREQARLSRKNRYDTDSLFKLKHSLGNLIRVSLKCQGYSKTSKTYTLLGADFTTVQQHLIDSAIRNYGEYRPDSNYHIDHIIPCAVAETEEELLKLQHYSNLQYLYPKDNRAKSDRLDWTLS